MGTGLEADQQLCAMSDNVGILPRSVHHLFTGIEMLREEAIQNGQTPPEFRVQAQFLELYNEEIIDLLEPTTRVNLISFPFFFFLINFFRNYSGNLDGFFKDIRKCWTKKMFLKLFPLLYRKRDPTLIRKDWPAFVEQIFQFKDELDLS